MENDQIFAEKPQASPEVGEKPRHTASLVLGILAIVLGLLIPLIGEILSLVGMVQVKKHEQTHDIKSGKVCCIVGFWLSLINHILGIVLLLAA